MGIKIMRTPRWVMACYAIIILAGIFAAQPKRNDQLVTSSGIVGKVTKGIVPKGGAPAANN